MGDQRKNAEKLPKLYIVFFSAFFLWSPIGNHEKKSCLNKLKFWEASRNHKRSLSWKFQYSFLKNEETSHIPASISENPVPLSESNENWEKYLTLGWSSFTLSEVALTLKNIKNIWNFRLMKPGFRVSRHSYFFSFLFLVIFRLQTTCGPFQVQ